MPERERFTVDRFLEILDPKEKQVEDDDAQPWEVIPPGIEQFVTSKQYLGLPPLSRRQLKALREGLGKDGVDLFSPDNKWNELILAWGKGSGKDYLSSIAIAYFTYVICCLKKPAKYFGMPETESVEILNVATRAEQAEGVFFKKLKERLSSPCFARWLPRINRNNITFPGKNVNCYSVPSNAQKWEGYNIIAWVMDEADAMRSEKGYQVANDIYGVLRTSAVSRFPTFRWIGIIISYPRQQAGFLFKQLKEQKRQQTAYTDIAATWEVNPFYDEEHPLFRTVEWVQVEDKMVPKPMAKDFRENYAWACMVYCCEPPPVEGAFIEFPDRIHDCEDTKLSPLLDVFPATTLRDVESGGKVETRRYAALNIVKPRRNPNAGLYYIHCDPGEVHDSYSIAVGHAVPGSETRQYSDQDGQLLLNPVEIDQLLTWEPSANRAVDYLDVDQKLMYLCKWLPVAKITFDKFQSASSVQKLVEAGYNASQIGFARSQQYQMYRAAKIAIYNQMLHWPSNAHARLYAQFSGIIRKGDQITHDEGISGKDDADAVVTVFWYASGAGLTKTGREVQETLHGSSSNHSVAVVPRRLSR